MADIQDLDVIVPEPKRVKFGGVEYELPPDLPMEIFLRINRSGAYVNENGEPDQVKQIESLTDSLADLFTWQLEEKGIPAEARDQVRESVHKVLMRRGARYCFTLVREIYRDDDDAAEESAEADPTTPPVPLAAD